ncbi:hypothetical protein C2857_002927 [Epichloe festucae Fl1]|uniref:Uncharacterized protein n=1 Tax=Epichloe festucae (strain Fl1) TaxID=877507 RepID=A0A7S9PVK3_EPIFF|nr:hypothetical protein C2857_002927 [Epichloe festucae Fl1]
MEWLPGRAHAPQRPFSGEGEGGEREHFSRPLQLLISSMETNADVMEPSMSPETLGPGFPSQCAQKKAGGLASLAS